MKTPIHFFNQRRHIVSVLTLVILALVLFGPLAVNTALAQIPIDPLCFGDVSGTYNNWAARFLDGAKFCDVEGEEHGGTSGADGVDAMDFDGDCDIDIITGWEQNGKVFIYLNPTFSTRPAATCPTRLYPDNTEERTGTIINQWPLIEVKRDGHPDSPFSGVEDAIFADNDGDGVADYVLIATEDGRMDMFASFMTPDGKWHTFDLKDGDEYFMRGVVGDIDGQGCPDILGGSKTVENANPSTPNRTGDIRWWRCPAGWTPELWKNGAPLPDFGSQSEMGYFKDLWGGRNMMNTQIKWIMEMNIVNLVPGSNPNSALDYPEILFTDRRKVGYLYLVDPAKIDKEEGWEFISIDDPGGSDFRWYWLGQLIDDDGDNDFSIDDPNDPPEIVATYNGDQENGVFARWYQRGNPVTITINDISIQTYTWNRNDVVLNGRFLPWGYDTSHQANRTNKAAGIADVNGDGHPEIIATIRGSHFSGAFYLKPESGLEPPSCTINNCNPDGQEWLIGRISPHYPDNIKFDNLALVDADLDCDVDVFSVEENGVGGKGLGTVWYENTLEQGSANAAVCNNPPTLSDPVVLPVDGGFNGEGRLYNAHITFTDPDINDAFTCTVNYGLGEQNGTIGLVDPADPTTHQCVGPDHLYQDNGDFLVTMTVSDGFVSETRSISITIYNVAPTVEVPVVSPSPADINQTVTAVSSFTDPAGNLDSPFTCTVNYGSGPEAGTINNQTCSGPAHAYDAEGDYTITVAVTDKDGDTGSRSTTLIVTNLPPVVSIPVISPSPSNEGGSVNASAIFSDGADNGPYTCSVDYGDGSGSQAGTVNGNTCNAPAHTYDDNSSYTVTISVADGDGDTGDSSAGHQVNNVAPTANFTLSPTEIFVGESANVAFSNAYDPSTADTTAGFTYSYDCEGDGSWDASGLGLDSYTCQYPSSGAFTVKGQISDKDGGATVYSAVITVLSPQQALQTLIDDVNALKDAGVINQGQAISLIVKLQNAINSLNAGNTTSTVNKIQAFTNQVEGFVNGGNLTLEEGQPLLDKAQHIIDAIQLSV